MTEPIYKVGDILEFGSSYGFLDNMGSIPGPLRALIIKVNDLGYEYIMYRLLVFSKECNNFINTYVSVLQKDILTYAKRIGHIDISMLMFEESNEPNYEKMLAAFACVESANLRHELVGIKNENEKLKRENEELRAANEKLAEEGARYLQKITCAEKELSEAAMRIYEAREHLNLAIHNN